MRSFACRVAWLLAPAACGQGPAAPSPATSPLPAPPPAASAPSMPATSGSSAARSASVPSPSSPAGSASSAAGAPAGATRVHATVATCLPVGYGLACACTLDSADPALHGHAKLEACVGSRDPNSLTGRLGAAPMAGGAGAPLSLWMDVTPAPESKRYCGVLILDSGAHFEIVDFERAPAP